MRRSDVRTLQERLRRVGFLLRVDGDFGPQTHDQVRRFQRGFAAWKDALPLTGSSPLQSRTWRAIRWSAEHGGLASNHFTWRQTACEDPNNRAIGVRRDLLRLMERIRANRGPFEPVSVFRTVYWNGQQGGVRGSEHTLGIACDIPSSLRLSIGEAARLGADGIGDGGGVVLHVDTRGYPSRWHY